MPDRRMAVTIMSIALMFFRVSVQLNVADMPAIAHQMERRFFSDLFNRSQLIVNRDVKRVRIVDPVCDIVDRTELQFIFLTNFPESPSAGVAIKEKFSLCFSVASSALSLID